MRAVHSVPTNRAARRSHPPDPARRAPRGVASRLSWLLLTATSAGCNSSIASKDGVQADASVQDAAAAPAGEAAATPSHDTTRTPASKGADELAAAEATPVRSPPADYQFTSSPGGLFTAAWRPMAGAVPVNELFEIELLLFEGRVDSRSSAASGVPRAAESGASRLSPPCTGNLPPLCGAKVQVSAWMPEHMHGMSRRPESVETAPGRYLVRGMLLHMEGAWQLFVDVMAKGKSERAEFDLDLKAAAPIAIEGFTADEVRALLQLSPLPDPPADPTNRYADEPRAARLGQFLFFDKRFSASGAVSCSTCHQPALAFTDGKHFGEVESVIRGGSAAGAEPPAAPPADGPGAKHLDRHTPSLINVAYNRWFFWDGRADSLWAQPLQPLEDAREHATTRLEIAHAFGADPDLARAYEATFGALPDLADPQRFPPKGKPGVAEWDAMAAADQSAIDGVYANFGKALAAYERRLVSRSSPFDEFVAGVRAGDLGRQRALSPQAREGLRLFVGPARCVRCHSGPNFTDREFHDNRVPTLTGEPRRDGGRNRGIPMVQADRFNGTGPFSDAPSGDAADKLHFLPRSGDSWSEFKTPSLRNVELTAPYMHQGQLATLDDVLAYYNTLEAAVPTHSPERTLMPLQLPDESLAALREFLRSLTDVRLDPALLQQPPTPYLP
jgi:cytochrome c peroxidase